MNRLGLSVPVLLLASAVDSVDLLQKSAQPEGVEGCSEEASLHASCPPIARAVFRWKDRDCQVGAVNRDLRFTFAVDDDEMMAFPENNALLDSVLGFMNAVPSVELEVGQHMGGYTRLRKSQEIQLSQLRAQAIVTALADRGIEQGRLSPVGYGTSKPLISRDSIAVMDQEGKERAHGVNRRTEFKILRCE
ncbi:MAG: OmpA family protein [Flavobacteriales bacterium]|nr:OmpA family protein [Flavobacteriales bacterium]